MKPLLYSFLIYIFIQPLTAQTWSQLGADIADGQWCGMSLDLSENGTTIAVGAPATDNSWANSGSVFIYDLIGNAWVQRGLSIDGEGFSDISAWSVNLSADGNTVAIGAILNNGGGGVNADRGHVRVFEWNSTAWVQKGLDIDGEHNDDESGNAISIDSSGNTLAIGASLNDDGGLDAGHVRVYKWNGTAWIQSGIDIDGENAGDLFGYSVSLNTTGEILAIGAINYDDLGNSLSQAGYVRVFEWNGSAWLQQGNNIVGGNSGDTSGESVSLSSDGSVVAIGAIRSDGNGSSSGQARIFEWNGSAWTQKGADINGVGIGDQSGKSVSVSSDGNIVAVGSYTADPSGIDDAGQARVFQWDGLNWNLLGTSLDGQFVDEESGYAVSLSANGGIIALGEPKNDNLVSDAGRVRVFSISCLDNTGIDSVVACDSYTWINNITYTTDNNTAKDTLVNSLGCDSIVTLNLTIHYSSIGQDFQTACDTYTWINGNTYNNSNNTATHTLINSNGCDSIVHLNLTMQYSNEGYDSISTCDSHTWINGVTYTNSNNTAQFTLQNESGCDSIVTLNLVINNSSSETNEITSCEPITWIDGNIYSTNNNTATYTTSNSLGCDSVITLDLTIIDINSTVTDNEGSLTANEINATYQWLDCDDNFSIIAGETNRNFTTNINGSYAVSLTKNNCTDTSNCFLINNVPINEKEVIQNITSYPNPFTNSITIGIDGAKNDYFIKVFDNYGKLILEQNFPETKIIHLELAEFETGLYFIELSNTSNKKARLKVLKN